MSPMLDERYAKKIEDMRNRYAFVISRQIASVSYFFLANIIEINNVQ